MKIKLKFTDEHIALIRALDFKKIDIREIVDRFSVVDDEVSVVEDGRVVEYRVGDIMDRLHIDSDNLYGIDNFNLWGGTYIWEQMAYILGIYDRVIESTKEDPDGPKFPEEDMEHMRDLDCFIVSNLVYIEQILHQFCTEGIQPGVTYWAYDHQLIWHRADEKDKPNDRAL